MQDKDPEEVSPEDDDPQGRLLPLTDSGEHKVPLGETLPEPPENKKIHKRRPIPLVPTKKPHKVEHEGGRPGD